VGVTLLAAACRKVPAPKPSAARLAPSALARASASTAASAKPPVAPSNPAPSGSADDDNDEVSDDFELSEEAQNLFQREFAAARKASSQKRYDEAVSHYTKALSMGKNDAAALGERGYVRFLQHDLKGAEGDLYYAAGAPGEPEVQAQIWYNWGLVSSAQEQAEDARAAFARSLELRPNHAVEAKLGGGSRCTSTFQRKPEADPRVAVLPSWLKTHEFLGLPSEPKNEQEARKMVCSSDGLGEVGQMDRDCSDGDISSVSCCGGFGRFMLQEMSVVPRPGGRIFAIQHGTRGGWPRGCQGVPSPELTIYGKVVLVATKGRELESNEDYKPPSENEDRDPACRLSPNFATYDVYDLDRGTHLVSVSSLRPLAPKLSIDEAGTTLTLSGHGCSERIALK
jgi:hypothetical protein